MTEYRSLSAPWIPRRDRLRVATSKALSFILQRFPFSTHVGLLILCAIGPIFAPQLLAFFLVFTHVVFACCQTRTAYGIWACWRGTKAHAERDWMEYYILEKSKLENIGQAEHVLAITDVQHIIIVPAYKEDHATLRETLDVLASHPLASTCYYVCLGMEEREAGSSAKAKGLADQYRTKGAFAAISFSIHPGNIIGESAGKSSNVNWATRHMFRRRDISSLRAIYTIMDADTAFASDFFLASAVHFSLAQPIIRKRMMFVPPIIFDRNSPDVPIFTRATDIFWSCAGLGCIYPGSSCKIPTSAYGVSMELAKFCDFWEAGPEAIGEDMHFYCKALFETKGNVHAVTIYSPASQMNVVGKCGNNAVHSYMNDVGARWTQAVRHLWGSLDFGYCWHRILTGQIGRSRPKEGYMAINTDAEGVVSHVLEAGTSRTPSPSVTSTTLDSSEIEELDDEHLILPRARKFTNFGVGTESDATIKMEVLPVIDLKLAGEEKDVEEGYLQEEDLYDDIGEVEKFRLFPFVVLMTRLYEAHLMVAQVFLFGVLNTIYPKVLYRNGTISFMDPYDRGCTVSECMLSIFESPFAAGVTLPDNTPPGLHPSWMIPTILICAGKAARYLAAVGITSTVLVCIIHDCYHHTASWTRWVNSDRIYKEAVARGGSSSRLSRLPARYLGIRPRQSCRRQWPKALLDFAAIPAGEQSSSDDDVGL